ncbi:ankyrin [Pectobacterium brasiliense]|nr:ankyrin [Pectobacterium brasiliense]
MQWLARIKWVGVVILGLLTACQAGGHSMRASELFEPPVVAVLESIQKGDESAARHQLSQGVNLNIQDKKAVTLALKLGVDPNYKDGFGDSAVNSVAGAKDPDWLRIILDAGGDPNAIGRRGQPAIFSAINEQRWADIKLLVEKGADLNLEDQNKRNSALYAAYVNEYEIVYWLIEQGASFDTYSSTGSSLAWRVHDSLSIMSPKSPHYPWALKVKQLLLERGVKFPPLSPTEVRERWEKGEPL